MEKIGSIGTLNRGGLPLKKGPLHVRLLAHIYEGVLFLGVDLPDLKCRWTRSFPWD